MHNQMGPRATQPGKKSFVSQGAEGRFSVVRRYRLLTSISKLPNFCFNGLELRRPFKLLRQAKPFRLSRKSFSIQKWEKQNQPATPSLLPILTQDWKNSYIEIHGNSQ